MGLAPECRGPPQSRLRMTHIRSESGRYLMNFRIGWRRLRRTFTTASMAGTWKCIQSMDSASSVSSPMKLGLAN